MTDGIAEPLFILEMANNHMGSLAHGRRIVRALRDAVGTAGLPLGIKLQYRDLDTFIHPAYRDRHDLKYIKRFSETRLMPDELGQLTAEIKACGFVAVCTPFDEPSVDLLEAHGHDVVKIASCSFTDWPLLERVARTDRPVIASTAGAGVDEIDRVVSFLDHRRKAFALMACVAEYPTADADLNLGRIDFLRARYPGVRIGYSTHEDPERTAPVQIAIAKGATLFEKHVGLPTRAFGLNAYSADPAQVTAWLAAAREAYEMCGTSGERVPATDRERSSLRALRRGAFARRAIGSGEPIGQGDVFMAFPAAEKQVTANDWGKYMHFVARADIPEGAPIMAADTEARDVRERVYHIAQQVKRVLEEGHIVAPGETELEISHHYGLERFDEFGMTMITVVNREYCKKLIVVLPGQGHPEQYHRQKEETFHILHGRAEITLDGTRRSHAVGDVITVARGVRHAFRSETGAVFEEISSTHYKDDSFYTDPAIQANPDRKTFLTYWMG
jgi:sialic acid synthase SpsE/quercetin dioxygenase-like cupin family protein